MCVRESTHNAVGHGDGLAVANFNNSEYLMQCNLRNEVLSPEVCHFLCDLVSLISV